MHTYSSWLRVSAFFNRKIILSKIKQSSYKFWKHILHARNCLLLACSLVCVYNKWKHMYLSSEYWGRQLPPWSNSSYDSISSHPPSQQSTWLHLLWLIQTPIESGVLVEYRVEFRLPWIPGLLWHQNWTDVVVWWRVEIGLPECGKGSGIYAHDQTFPSK